MGKPISKCVFFNESLDKDTCMIYGSPSKDEVAYSISQTPAGGYVMSGYRNHGNGDCNPYLVKTDSNGIFLWDKEFELGELCEDAGFSLVSSDGFIYMVSDYAYEDHSSFYYSKLFVAMLNQEGSVIWEKEFDDDLAILNISAISERQDGSILIAGNTTRITPRNPLGKMVGIVYNIDTAGNEIYEQYFVINPDPNHDSLGYETHYVRSLDITPDGGYVVAGFITQLPGQDLWVVKFDSNGCYDPTYGGCVVGVSELSDVSFQLSVWPNPAQDVLNIETDSPMEEIRVYDQLGSLAFSYQMSAISSFEQLDLSSFKSGLYFLVVKTDKGVETKKVIKQD
ncbi:MAG: T9SS type A sorting domain-containing protein [Salibacteraceae bacterium]|nr:T9SS type A sorting domain-containing protein [Salibacteraceae bacterium]